ncbi:hypothetical protein NMG60_11003741 [Bertholletia excelsa]
MEFKHSSHDHSLTFSEIPGENAKQFNCYACSCAELPQELTHPCHPEHAVILHPNPPTTYFRFRCICDVCRKICTRFIYHCSTCKFDVDINCALMVHNIQQKVQHTGHQHQLIPLHKPAFFFCDACGIEHKGSSYLCTTCGFWANQQCVLSPKTIKLRENYHLHPLTLIYSVPYEYYYHYMSHCQICHERIYRRQWIYVCDKCQYLVHVNCATSEIQDSMIETKTEDSSSEQPRDCKTNNEDQDNEINPISLPMPDESIDLVTQFIKDVKLEGNCREELDIINNSHEHPLFFFDNQVEDEGLSGSQQPLWNIEKRKGEQCHGCQRTISVPFYYCAQCNFSLHQWCAKLPKELWHPTHPEHSLLLITERPSYRWFYNCASCESRPDMYVFGCTKCEFYLDIKCASLPRTIKHEAHKHLLALRQILSECSACGGDVNFGYECDICKYNLHIGCGLLPRTIKHRYDEHPFALIYGASSLDQVDDEYYCEICEEEVNSEYWFYHCHHCDQSLHMKCIRPILGGILAGYI